MAQTPSEAHTLSALRDARDALSNAIAWLDAMHVTTSRAERRRVYATAHASVNAEILRLSSFTPAVEVKP